MREIVETTPSSSVNKVTTEIPDKDVVDLRSGIRVLATAIIDNLRLLLLGSVVAGVVAYGVASLLLPKWYTSVAYLALDQAGARDADARMRSMPILDKVLSNSDVPGATIEAQRRYLEKNRRMVAAPGELAGQANLFRLEVSDRNPKAAQSTSSRFIDHWLESTKPAPDKRAILTTDIERIEGQTKSISQMIDRLQKEAPNLISPSSLQGELATPISNLITKRDQNFEKLISLRRELNGLSRDVIFGPPDLPQEPSWPNKGIIAVLTAAVVGLLLLIFVILRRFLATAARDEKSDLPTEFSSSNG